MNFGFLLAVCSLARCHNLITIINRSIISTEIMQDKPVMAFATEASLRRWYNARKWWMDTTYSTTPHPVFQAGRKGSGGVLIVRSLFGSKDKARMYPRAYIVIPSATRVMLRGVFRNIFEAAQDRYGLTLQAHSNWEAVGCDFEPAFHSLISEIGDAHFGGQRLPPFVQS